MKFAYREKFWVCGILFDVVYMCVCVFMFVCVCIHMLYNIYTLHKVMI